MKIATWNVNSLKVRLTQVMDWLQANPDVDVLGLQELKMESAVFPHAALEELGYHCFAFGQKTYNGVALIVKNTYAVNAVQHNNPLFEDPQARLISACIQPLDNAQSATTEPPLQVVCAYFPNGQDPESDKFEYKMRWLTALRQWMQQCLEQNQRLVLLGDFNIVMYDRDSHDPVRLAETIHHTSIERSHFQGLLDLGLLDAFNHFSQPEKSYSWWDYRELAFRRNKGLRIDHILVSQALAPQLAACTIDKGPRRNERPSDHTPVILSLHDTPSG